MKATSYRMVNEIIHAADALNAIDDSKDVTVIISSFEISVQISFRDDKGRSEDYVVERATFDGHYRLDGMPGNEDDELPKLLAWVRSYYMPQNAKPKEKTQDEKVKELREDVDRILDNLGIRT